jgi:hypothetical protein
MTFGAMNVEAMMLPGRVGIKFNNHLVNTNYLRYMCIHAASRSLGLWYVAVDGTAATHAELNDRVTETQVDEAAVL